MGEGFGNDAELMDYVSSANIACGFHAGNAETMRRTIESAIEKGVAVGAHPGYPDRKNFGRLPRSLATNEVYDIVMTQISAFSDICKAAGAKMKHIKPHGALYNQAAKDEDLAAVIAQAVFDLDPSLLLFGLSGSVSISEARKRGLRTASEVFADRTYRSDGSLTPRNERNALIHDAHQAVEQILQMVKNGTVTATDGQIIPISAGTVCIHGDGENALEFAKVLRQTLIENGITIKAL